MQNNTDVHANACPDRADVPSCVGKPWSTYDLSPEFYDAPDFNVRTSPTAASDALPQTPDVQTPLPSPAPVPDPRAPTVESEDASPPVAPP